MSLVRIALGILALAALAAAGVGASGAAFTSSSKSPGNAITAADDWTGPAVALANPGSPVRGTVALNATASDERSTVATVVFQHRPAAGGSWSDIGTDTGAPWTTNWNTAGLADGAYDLRALATDSAGNATASALVAARLVDNTAPSATLANPGTPLTGTVALDATAGDGGGSGVADVTFQYSRAGAGEWADIASDAQAPYAAQWDTTQLADGEYDLRVALTDAAGNTATSAVVAGREVANSRIVLEDPGEYLRGTGTFNATVSGSGVWWVEFEARSAGTASWLTIGWDLTPGYSTGFDSTQVPDGSYEVRAVMVARDGRTASEPRTVTVDNTAPTGTNVQGAPKSSGANGRIEAGDGLVLTFSEKMDPATLVSGWSGTAPTALYARLTHSSGGDRIEFFRNAAGTQATGLGVVGTGGDFIDSGATVTFAATATLNAAGTAVTITLGTPSGQTSALNTVGGSTTLRWTPNAAAKDIAGNAAATTQLTEPGSNDRDF